MIVSSGSSSSSTSSTSSSTITSKLTKNIIIIIGFKLMAGNKGGWFTSYIVTRERINIRKKSNRKNHCLLSPRVTWILARDKRRYGQITHGRNRPIISKEQAKHTGIQIDRHKSSLVCLNPSTEMITRIE